MDADAGQAGRVAGNSDAASVQELFEAISANDMDRVAALLAAAPALANARSDEGQVALIAAAERGLTDVARALLAAGAAPTATDGFWTPLYAAAHTGPYKRQPALAVADLVLAYGAPDDIFNAAALGRGQRVVELLAGDPSLANARDGIGCTPLFVAAWTGYPVVVERLLQAGADPNVRSRAGQTPLDTSVSHIWEGEQSTVARLLIEYGANPSFFAACVVGSPEHVKRYLEADPALVNRPFDQGGTPLEVAAEAGHVAVGALLVQAGAEVDIFSAASLGRQAQIETLLRHDPALLDAKRRLGGYRPLHCAAECGHPEIVRRLIQRGADVNVRNAWGFTPLHLAVLAARGYPPTAAHLAISNVLLRHGAAVNARDDYNRSVLDVATIGAAKPGAVPGIVEVLTRHGAG